MLMGKAYKKVLTSHERQALQTSCDILIDSIFDDLQDVKKPEDVADTILGMYLPERYLYKYTPIFLKKFGVCLITVAWKLAQPKRLALSSLAEELAAWIIIQEAKRELEDESDVKVKNPFDAFIDDFFEDTDFEFLYEDRYDGIEETELAQVMGISSLAFKDWFVPFSDEPSRTPHPYVVEHDMPK